MKIINQIVIMVICLVMPISQAQAAFTLDFMGWGDSSVVTNQGSNETNSAAPNSNEMPSQKSVESIAGDDIWPAGTSSVDASDITEPLAEDADALLDMTQEELVVGEEEDGFWSRKKVLAVFLLLGLAGGIIGIIAGASGSGGSSGGGNDGPGGGSGGGANPSSTPTDPFVPPVVPDGPTVPGGPGSNPFPGSGPVPHHPEPSTFALLGLGLLLPYLRKRKA